MPKINTNDDLFEMWIKQLDLPKEFKKLCHLAWKSLNPDKVYLVEYSDGKQKVVTEEWEL